MRLVTLVSAMLVMLGAARQAVGTPPAAAAAGGEPPLRRVTLDADRVEVNDRDKMAYATGHARLEYEDIVVTAEALQANYQTRTVSATGEVVLQQGSRVLSGSDLSFDLDKGTGQLRDIHAEVDRVFYTGKSIQVSPLQWVITGSTITTCDRAHPHYKITGEQVVVKPGESATIRRASVWFGGHRLLTWPRYRMSLREETGEQQALLPRVGTGARDGIYINISPRLSPPDNRLQHRIDARLTSNRGVRGLIGSSYRMPWGEIYALASQAEDRQEITDIFALDEDVLTAISIDRVPEVGVRVLPQTLTSTLNVSGRLSAARVKEFPDDVDSKRLAVEGVAELGSYRISPVLGVSEVVGARYARYERGLHQTVLSVGTTLHYRKSPRFGLDLGYVRRTANGETPFIFDRIQIGREIAGGMDWTVSPVWQLGLDGRFDLDRHRFRDADITLSRTAHCLVYSLKWRQIRREFSVGVAIAQMPGG